MILAIDQGTTGTTCLVVDEQLRIAGRGYREIRQSYPQPGWVEHDPDEILSTVHEAAADALGEAGIAAAGLAAIGITNQRETTVVWGPDGRPLHPAIVWQDRRTAERCRELPADLIRERTGLVPDPYFSATKLEWLLARVEADVLFGTVESWLAWNLTGGEAHVTDATNASRTMLARLDPVEWDPELAALFGVPAEVLPRIVPSSGVVGEAEIGGARVPLAGLAGDQQAALFGQACFRAGDAKATYGTGSFVLANQGEDGGPPPHGILRTAAAQPGVTALEGAVFVTGAAVQWLRDGLGVIADAGRDRGAGPLGRVDRRRPLRPRAHRARLAVLGRRRPRAHLRHHPRHRPGRDRPGGARGDRLPDRRRRLGDAGSPCARSAPTAAPPGTRGSCSSSPTSSGCRSRWRATAR